MKKLNAIFQAIKAFFYSLTRKGREEKYYQEALKNMQGPEAFNLLQKRVLQRDINSFLNETKQKRTLTPDAKIALAKNKFQKDLALLKLTICPETHKLISV
ncbi:hypothetical protein E0K83_03985 [Gramella sp. BOM4]|nr:hypothetical protein [Christiangramia bathymodioli]